MTVMRRKERPTRAGGVAVALGLLLSLSLARGAAAAATAGSVGPAPASTEQWVAASFPCLPGPGGALGAVSVAAGRAPEVFALGSIGERDPAGISRRPAHANALLTALMSAVVPGAGQIRNGSTLRGLVFMALEVSGWVAYGAFQQGAREKRSEYDGFAGDYWDYDRYHTRAPDPDSCSIYGCPAGLWNEDADAEILAALEGGQRSRFHEYVRRDAYACGWDTPESRALYRSLWDDRESLLSAKSWTGRLIFLNHLASAVDAFIGARGGRLGLGERTDVRLGMRGSLAGPHPEVRVTHTF